MTMTTDNVAVLFADICGSTALYETVGDAAAHRMTNRCLSRLGDAAVAHAGTVIKTIGDCVLAVFPTADAAFHAAERMNQGGDDRLSVRTGFHVGPVIRTPDDIFGDTVNLAARIVGMARPEEVLLTQSALDNLSPVLQSRTALLDTTRVKGKRDSIDIHRILPLHEEEATVTAEISDGFHGFASLVLTWGECGVTLPLHQESCVIGRDAACDLTVPSTYASRRHCTITMARGRFLLNDQSTNGTYITLSDGTVQFVKREAVQLLGDGLISLGVRADGDHDRLAIHFRCSYG